MAGTRGNSGVTSGKPRLSPKVIEEYRAKIDTNTITNSLIGHIKGEVEMTSTQVTAALGLLRKCLPDLAALTINNDADSPFLIKDISSSPYEGQSNQWLESNSEIIEGETVQ